MGWDVLEFAPRQLVMDKAPADLPGDALNFAQNVDFFTGNARSLSEIVSSNTPTGIPNAIQYFQNSTVRKFAYGTDIGARTWDGITDVSILPGAGLVGSNIWSMDAFGSYLIATNATPPNVPHGMEASAAVLAPMPGWIAGQTCKYIATHRNVIFAANFVEAGTPFPNRVRWSASSTAGGLPQVWAPLPSNDAGSQDLEIPGGEVTGMCAMGDTMYIAGLGGVWAARWVGGAYVYQFRSRSGEWGMRGPKCMVSLGDAVAILTRNDLLLFDDTTHKSLMIGRVANVLKTAGPAQLLYVEMARQLYLFYGLSTDAGAGYTRALIWDRDSDTWGNRTFAQVFTAFGKGLNLISGTGLTWTTAPGTWDAQTAAWNPPVYDTDLYLAANASIMGRPGMASFNWAIERDSMPGPDGENIRVRSLEVDVDGPIGQQITLRIGSAQYPGQSPTWGRIGSYTLGSAQAVRHDDLHKGRYMSYRITGNGDARVTAVRFYHTINAQKP